MPRAISITSFLLLAIGTAAGVRQVEFSYVGCYVDNTGGVRDLRGLIGTSALSGYSVGPTGYVRVSGAMTHQLCSSICSLGGFKYFGVQYSSECYCGNFFGSQGAAGSSTECYMSCSGNSSQKCGGLGRNSVFVQTYLYKDVFIAGSVVSVTYRASFAQPRYQTVSASSLIVCSSQCRAGCQAVIFSQQQGLCHLLRFAAVPAELASFTGKFLTRS